ncbi:hypothetical protein WT41_05505 [Burkholderia territorii]|nr:hypothetical protein WT38_14060 [Burkholderia territorii]KWA48672.1 hypothetical protein WT41_05505 [Burkholderia territorii]
MQHGRGKCPTVDGIIRIEKKCVTASTEWNNRIPSATSTPILLLKKMKIIVLLLQGATYIGSSVLGTVVNN